MQGELVRHRIAASTVWHILHEAGIDPASCWSGPRWRQFLITPTKAILAVDTGLRWTSMLTLDESDDASTQPA